MNIFITGSSGFLGNNLKNELDKKKIRYYSLPYKKINSKKQINQLVNFFKKKKINGIIHLATYYTAEHRETEIDDLIKANIKFGVIILEAARQSKVRWIINVGTKFQNMTGYAYSPVNLYSSLKESFENIGEFYSKTYDIIFTTLRISHVGGKGDKRDKIFNSLKKKKKNSIIRISAPNQLMEILSVKDVINAILNLVKSVKRKKKIKSLYFLNSKNIISVKDLVSLYNKISGKNISCVVDSSKKRKRDIKNFKPLFPVPPNWKQNVGLNEILKNYLDGK